MRRWLLLGLALAAAGCARADDRASAQKGPSAPASPHMALERAEFGEAQAGKPVWKATAVRARYHPGAKAADLEGVEALFYEDGKPVTRGRAPAAVWRQEGGAGLALTGGITLTVESGARGGVAAREARWDPAVGQLRAGGGVRFWQGGHRLEAGDMHADRALRRVELRGGVKGQFALGPGTDDALPGSTSLRAAGRRP